MTLYRTYRPKTLDDLAGQEHIVSILREAMRLGRIAHAYLLVGMRGTGKTSTARILAHHLLTRDIADPARTALVETALEDGNLVDCIEIDAATHTQVENMRELLGKLQFTPVVASAKVYIIDEVHMLSSGAFNALLKTLEEPPPYAYFILATTELHKVPLTIQSRCQRFLFRHIGEDVLVDRLRTIAEKEGIQAEEEGLRAIARAADGGMRDAISLLDQLRTCTPITVEDVIERTGETGHTFVQEVTDAVERGDRETLLRAMRTLEENGIPTEVFLRLLLAHARSALHAAIRAGENTLTMQRRMDALLACARDVRNAPLPGLILESTLLSMMPPADKQTPPAPAPKPREAPPPPIAAPAPDERPSSPPADSLVTLADVRRQWPDILQHVQPASARMSLLNGTLDSWKDGTLLIRFSSNFHLEKASAPEGVHTLMQRLSACTGRTVKVSMVLADATTMDRERQTEIDLADAVSDVFL